MLDFLENLERKDDHADGLASSSIGTSTRSVSSIEFDRFEVSLPDALAGVLLAVSEMPVSFSTNGFIVDLEINVVSQRVSLPLKRTRARSFPLPRHDSHILPPQLDPHFVFFVQG